MKLDKTNTGFIHSEQIKINKQDQEYKEGTVEQCVNIYRTLQAITD